MKYVPIDTTKKTDEKANHMGGFILIMSLTLNAFKRQYLRKDFVDEKNNDNRKGSVMPEYDVMIIGSGTAGQTAAYKLRDAGFKIGLVEHSPQPGGTCALRGCQAKKYFYEGAETVARSRHMENIGIKTPAQADWGQLLNAKKGFTQKVPENTVSGLEKKGIDFIRGHARFTGEKSLSVAGTNYTMTNAIVATGAAPASLPIPGMELALDSRGFLELETLPRRILFVGGGFISFEFAHFAARLGPSGCSCVILEAGPRPLGPFDEEMVALLTEASARENITVHCQVEITGIEKRGSGKMQVHTADNGVFDTDLVVHGAGRSPAIDDLDLENADVTYSKKGISVDRFMTTSNPRIYAVGDCADTIQLARVADAEAGAAAQNIQRRRNGMEANATVAYSSVPSLLFTYPQYGMVGQTENKLKEKAISYSKSQSMRLEWPTYKRVGLTSAAYKILVGDQGEILGAHILSDSASGMIQTFSLAMKNNISVHKLHEQCILAPYPSRESDLIYMLNSFVSGN